VLAEPLPLGMYFISVITEIELLSFPALAADQSLALNELLKDVTVVPIHSVIKDEAIRLRRAHRLRVPDAIVAGTAAILDGELLSNDARLKAVPGLRCRPLALKA
jgi:hypothetical protein